MASFNAVDTGIEGLQDMLLKRAAATEKAVPAMLEAGAEVLVKAQSEEISGITSDRATGDLAASIKASKVQEKEDTKYVDVYPQGKNRRGERNATVGFVLQYGRSNMPARPWMTSANEKAAENVIGAMREAWEEAQG